MRPEVAEPTRHLPDGVQVVTGHPGPALGRRRRRARVLDVRDAHGDQHVVVDQLPGAVQEDRRLPPDRHGPGARRRTATWSPTTTRPAARACSGCATRSSRRTTALDGRPRPSFDAAHRAAATVAAGAGGVIFTPWLTGERVPVDDRNAPRRLPQPLARHHRADLVRAVLEGVAYNSRWLHEAVEQFAEAAARPRAAHRRRRAVRPVVPDPRRRARPHHRAGRRPRSTRTCAAPRCSPASRSARCARHEVRDLVPVDATFRPDPATGRPTTGCTPSSRSSTRPRRRCSGGSTTAELTRRAAQPRPRPSRAAPGSAGAGRAPASASALRPSRLGQPPVAEDHGLAAPSRGRSCSRRCRPRRSSGACLAKSGMPVPGIVKLRTVRSIAMTIAGRVELERRAREVPVEEVVQVLVGRHAAHDRLARRVVEQRCRCCGARCASRAPGASCSTSAPRRSVELGRLAGRHLLHPAPLERDRVDRPRDHEVVADHDRVPAFLGGPAPGPLAPRARRARSRSACGSSTGGCPR